MSHQAYSWVLQQGPTLKTIGRDGVAYGTRARAMRAVLSSIANAASATGENSHPGLPALIEESLYTKSHVLRIVDELTAEGWIEITEEGRGRGHATVYRICLDRGKVPLRDLSHDRKGPISNEKRSHLGTEKVPSDESTPLFPTDTTKDPTSRDESRRLCELLATLMIGNGCRPPTITDSWITDIDRMIRIDGLTPTNIENAIRWSQADPFWRGNVLSPRKLREKYDQLRLAAKQQRNGRERSTPIADHVAMVERGEFDEATGMLK